MVLPMSISFFHMCNSIFTISPFFIEAFAFSTNQAFLKFTRNILNYFIFYFFNESSEHWSGSPLWLVWPCSASVDGLMKSGCLLPDLHRADIARISMPSISIVKDFDVIEHIIQKRRSEKDRKGWTNGECQLSGWIRRSAFPSAAHPDTEHLGRKRYIGVIHLNHDNRCLRPVLDSLV